MSKADRILENFPWFYRATERTKLLSDVVRRLALPLEDADTHLFRIQRAHRLSVAEHAEDIVQLAAALNLPPFYFEDILTEPALDYAQKLELMRARVRRTARVHLKGLGTPWAVMEGAAIFLNAELVPEHAGDPIIKHLDADNFSHKATLEFINVPERPRETIYLHENPYRRKKVEPVERWQLNSWVVDNQNVTRAPFRLLIRGVSDHTVLPSIFSPTAGQGLFFNGVIPDGQTLIVDPLDGATLEGTPVDEWLTYFEGGTFDFAQANESAFVVEAGGAATMPFDGNIEDAFSRPFRNRVPVPAAPLGRSEWRFCVAEGVYDGNVFDYAVYETPAEPIGIYDEDFDFDGSVFDYAAAGVVGVGWDESIPCSFKLMLPPHVPQPKRKQQTAAATADGTQQPAQTVNHLSRVGSILPRFKAAGIRFFVDIAKDAWVLGTSVVRSAQADKGEGVEFHATRLQDKHADLLVPLDTNN